MVAYSPIVYDSTAKAHIILATGQPIDPSHIMVSSENGNLLKNVSDGLSVSLDGVVSSAPDNLLKVIDGKLVVTLEGDTGGIISADNGNYLRYGLDKGAFLDGNDVLSNGGENLLYIDSTDGKVMLTRKSLKDAGFVDGEGIHVVSSDTGNLIVSGSDGGAFLNEARVPTGVSSDANNVLVRGSDGKPYLSSSAITINPSDIVSTSGNNALTTGTDGKLYVRTVNASGLVDGNDKVLVISNDGSTVSTVLNMSYNQTTGLLSLLGKNGQTVATATVQASGSVLESAAIVTNPSGQPAGTYLALTFRLADGTLSTVYADLSALANVYSAGAGIDITNYVISAKLDANGGLKSTANGLAIDGNAAAPAIAPDMLSSDSGNLISLGSDNLLYVPMDCGEL